MDKTTKDKWLEELRSGKHARITGTLEAGGAYCPLGLLAVAAGRPLRDETGDSDPTYEWMYGVLSPIIPQDIWYLNDLKDYTFEQTADWIEEYVPVDDDAA
jgi:hypothetical protein